MPNKVLPASAPAFGAALAITGMEAREGGPLRGHPHVHSIGLACRCTDQRHGPSRGGLCCSPEASTFDCVRWAEAVPCVGLDAGKQKEDGILSLGGIVGVFLLGFACSHTACSSPVDTQAAASRECRRNHRRVPTGVVGQWCRQAGNLQVQATPSSFTTNRPFVALFSVQPSFRSPARGSWPVVPAGRNLQVQATPYVFAINRPLAARFSVQSSFPSPELHRAVRAPPKTLRYIPGCTFAAVARQECL